jgi:anti-sigma regulatory factor (Ser/Thr protein kinase)
MADAGTATLDRTEDAFRHEALLYAGQADFVDRTSSFIRDAVRADEPILVAVSADKIEVLRSELGGDADKVRFADMAELGRNPAQIIPAWREFVAEQAEGGRRFRGVGEPIWAERSAEELVECHRHESLLNLAFAEAPAWWLVCPYDTTSLEPTVIEEAGRTHPFVVESGMRRVSALYRGLAAAAAPFDDPLPEPRDRPEEMTFEMERLRSLRGFVSQNAEAHGLDSTRTAELVLAVNEVATNSLRHAGGSGVLRMWRNAGSLICEVRDRGHIEDPMVGRWRPNTDQTVGFGLWLVNALCDLVQVRSFPTGSVLRLHMALARGEQTDR